MAAKIFEKIGVKKPRKSAFDLSREQKLSCKMGDLIPTYVEEILPGDEFMVKTETMMRLAPMIAPVMHRVNVYLHYFFVPNRIVWDGWEEMITGGKEGNTTETVPNLSLEQVGLLPIGDAGTLADYFGIPTDIIGDGTGFGDVDISALPFRAYQQIFNDYYRDENLQDEATFSASDVLTMRKRAWEKDYFTSSLPFAQRGDAATIPVDYKDVSEVYSGETSQGNLRVRESGATDPGELFADSPDAGGAHNPARIENIDGVDINDLRQSSALQRWLEKSARGGYRYIETILSQFGVKSEDQRLQRAEYLGGGKQPIVISEVLNTTGTAEAPQGDMAGHGISTGVTNSFKKRFTEHGYVIGIMSVLPRTAYQQGVHKHWQRKDRFDFYWPDFANLGEQEVKNIEIYLTDDPVSNEGTFGYQQRFAEYKYGCSSVHGDFRNELDFWHMGRIFETAPALNEDFVSSDPTTRIFAVTAGDPDHLWVQLYHNVKARRPMPFFADPRLT